MKRLLLLLAFGVASLCSVMAEQVSPAEALRVASQLFGDTTRGATLSVAWDSRQLSSTRVEDVPTFYVITPDEGAGFVIVPADNALRPILGYSMTYSAPAAGPLPRNFEQWLYEVDATVRYVRENGVEANEAVAHLWSTSYKPVAATMLNTARWSQIAPYNDLCPLDGDAHSLTGCTQTAMAVIMYHYRWPERAKGVTSAYTTRNGLYVPSRDLNHAYDWNSMLETYTEGKYNDKQAEAVAVLMADLGHAFKAEYTAVDTGALPDMTALYENFGYSPASNMVMRNNYPSESWSAMLRREIEASRPIFYAGYTAEGSGHAFVLDGVDDNDYFHVNWGWGGYYDGFFVLNSLMLDDYLFDTQHWAVFGMRPMRDGEMDNWLSLSSGGLKVSTTEFKRDVPFEVMSISVSNYTSFNFSGYIRVGVCDKSGEVKSWATDAQYISVQAYYGSSTNRMKAQITEDIAEGDRLVVFFRSDSSQRWFKMEPYIDNACAEIVLKYASIGNTTSMSFDKNTGILLVNYDSDVRSALYLADEYIETGVTISKGSMKVYTELLQRDATYTIYLERKGVESKSIAFTLKEL